MENIEKMEQEAKIEITPYDTPWEIACMLINAEYQYTNVLKQNVIGKFFENDDLRRIGEHLINYCNTEKDGANG
ncbi:MAG: hypothetical protein U0L88_15115 [Acutalibacteraceae bacterium]|nr:hypothetical protein [Acutalibacteraceae bacterium]